MERMSNLRGPVVCNNGLFLSIQASSEHYCKPKNNIGPYSELEVCSFHELIKGWENPIIQYDQFSGNPCHVTYYNVSARNLLHLIDGVGQGIKSGSLPSLIIT